VRRIGLIGGLGWPSTEIYHRLINQDVGTRLGGNHCARLVMWSEDFELVAALQRAGDWDQAGAVMAQGARALQLAGADLLAICANTMHLVADRVRDEVDLPLVHLIEVVADAAVAGGLTRLGLLGTSYTMTSSLYPDVCGPRGLQVLVPGALDREAVHESIYAELTRGVVSARSRAVAFEAASRLVDDGADAVVLGCTELALVLHPGDLPVPVLDGTALHCRAIVDAAVDHGDGPGGAAGGTAADVAGAVPSS
jgi:aspartate racemase